MFFDDLPGDIANNTQYLDVVLPDRWNIKVTGFYVNN